MHRIIFFLTVACFFCCWTGAQPELGGKGGEKTEKPKTEISIVALGPKPTRKYKQAGGGEGPVMLLAKPGETPPPRLYYKESRKGEKKMEWRTLNVSYNNPSAMRSITPGKALALFRKLPGDGGYERYVTIPASEEGSRRVFFLTPSAAGPTPWNKLPKTHTITVNSKSLKGKQFILKNLSRFTVLHAFEDNVVSVEPMKMISYKRAKTGQLYRLAARYGTQKKIIYNTAVRLNGEGHVQLYVLYNANPRSNSGRSVGVFRTVISAPPKPEAMTNEAP